MKQRVTRDACSTALPPQHHLAAINACGKNGDARGAWRAFRQMREEGHAIEMAAYGALIHALCRSCEVDQAFAVLRQMPQRYAPDVYIFNCLLKGLARLRRLREAVALYDDMQKRGLQPDHITFAALCEMYSRDGDRTMARKMFDAVKGHNMWPAAQTYEALMAGVAAEGDVPAIQQMFAEMAQDRVAPRLSTYHLLIGAHGRAKTPEQALEVLDDLVQRGHQPLCQTYTRLIHAFGFSRQPERAWQMLERAQAAGISADVFMQRAVITSLSLGGKLDQARRYFAELLPAADVTVYNTLLTHLLGAGRLQETVDLFTTMQNDKGRPSPSLTSYHILMGGLVADRQLPRALALIDRLHSAGLQPTEKTFGIFIAVADDLDDHHLASKLAGKLAQFKAAPQDRTYAKLLDIFYRTDQARAGLQMFKQLKSPQVVHFNMAMNLYKRSGQADAVFALLQQMVRHQLTPDPTSFGTLLSAFYQHRRFQEVLNIVDAYDLPLQNQAMVAEVCRKLKKYEQAIGLCDRVLDSEAADENDRHTAWTVRLCCLQCHRPRDFAQEHRKPPFGPESLHWPRLLCSRVFAGVLISDEARHEVRTALAGLRGSDELGEHLRDDLAHALDLLGDEQSEAPGEESLSGPAVYPGAPRRRRRRRPAEAPVPQVSGFWQRCRQIVTAYWRGD